MATIVSAPPSAPPSADTRSAVTRGLGIGIGAVVLLVGAWFGYSAWRDSSAPDTARTSAAPVAPVAATNTVVDPHDRARAQIAADRIAQPAGDNAAETYLAILAVNPADSGARQALVEILPMVNDVANAAAEAGQGDELARLIALIEQADSGYAQLPRLKQRQAELVLATERVAAEKARREALALQEQERAARALAAPAPTTAAATPPPTTAPQTGAPQAVATVAPATQRAAGTVAAARTPPAATQSDAGRLASATPPPAASSTASIAAPVSQRAAIVDAVLLKRVEPRYPPQALARRLEGFVEVELSISASGQTTDVRVVRAEPNSPLFTREALRVARDWRYEPKTVDGVPTATTVRQRLNFRMPRG